MKVQVYKILFFIWVVLFCFNGCNTAESNDVSSDTVAKEFLEKYYDVTEDELIKFAEDEKAKLTNDNFFEEKYVNDIQRYEEYLEIDLIDQLIAIRALDNVEKYVYVNDTEIEVINIDLTLSKEDKTKEGETRYLYDYDITLMISQNDCASETINKTGKIRVFNNGEEWKIDHVDFQTFVFYK